MAMWDGIVGNAAQALAHPALTSAVRSLHPGVMPPAGGIAAYADGGPVAPGQADPGGAAPSGLPDPTDPRMSAIADAEDALGSVEAGQPLQPEHVQALQSFTNAFGPTALAHLHANVKQGLTMRPRKARLVVGAGSGKSDGIPARVNNVQEAKLSNGEFVMPVEAVHGAGNGDPALGAQRLQQLSAQLASMKPAGAVKAASLTPQASAVQPAGGPPINVDNVQQ
jgi:hypothetical protein